jgi:hypothetical protein
MNHIIARRLGRRNRFNGGLKLEGQGRMRTKGTGAPARKEPVFFGSTTGSIYLQQQIAIAAQSTPHAH